MGSFNTFCCVSHQTINPGEQCVIIPIARNSSWTPVKITTKKGVDLELRGATDSTCYSNAFWNPIAIPLRATYDDYGRFELVNDEDNFEYLKDFLHIANERCPVVHEGENEYHDVPLNVQQRMESFDGSFDNAIEIFDEIYEATQEYRSFFLANNQDYVPLQFMVIHKTAWDELVSIAENDNKTWDDRPNDRRSRLNRMLNGESRYGHMIDRMFWYALNSEFLSISCEGLHLPLNGSRPDKYYNANKETFNAEEFLNDFKFFLDTRAVLIGMNFLGLQFSPLVYASQDYKNEIGENVARFISKVSRQITDSYREEDDDE